MKRFVIIMSALLASALPLSNVFVTKAMAKDVTVKVGGDIQAAIDQVSAGVDNISLTGDNDKVYDLQGRRVPVSQVKKGIYIRNGCKFIVR